MSGMRGFETFPAAELFGIFDRDNDGFIVISELHHLLGVTGDRIINDRVRGVERRIVFL